MATIKIKRGYADGTLDLSDKGHTCAKRKAHVVWRIKRGANVSSIEWIELKPDTPADIFSIHPYKKGKKWKAEISRTAVDYDESKYFIKWKGADGFQRVCDPKISIKPGIGLFGKIIALLFALFGLFSLLLVRKNKK